MPELPEVETVCRTLDLALRGCSILSCSRLDWPRTIANLSPDLFQAALQQRRISGVERRAKYVLIRLDYSEALAIHLRMSGQLTIQSQGFVPDVHTHVVFDLDNGSRLAFRDERKFGRISLLDSDGWALLDQKLGPEPLGPLQPGEFEVLLRRRRGAIKPLLLNQAVVAGLGNIYVDEALWAAGIHPLRTVMSLSHDEIMELFRTIQHVLRSAIEYRGTTFGKYVDGLGEPGSNQQHLNVYGRAGNHCPRCGSIIIRTVVAQRGTHLCIVCQPSPTVAVPMR
ncbi:MAG: bifunctional DNA-formamidopyrimidine glycosylase/DNA-(apurinic or apyrimidinic site) lyase [Herpetosiphon sp.]